MGCNQPRVPARNDGVSFAIFISAAASSAMPLGWSVAGLVSWGGSVYGSTKGAVHQLTKAAAIEGAPFNIRCNAGYNEPSSTWSTSSDRCSMACAGANCPKLP